jgi:hypothetical protein
MGHLVTCFLAFLIERTLEIKLKKANLISAPEQVREALDSLQVSTLEIGDPSISLYLPSTPSSLAKDILEDTEY